MKISERAKKDFAFYRDSLLDMIGHDVGVDIIAVPGGHTAIECWYAADTLGKLLECSEPELLAKVLRSKQSVNLQIKLWAEDIADGMLLTQRELSIYTYGWPDWIFKAVMQQAARLAKDKLGFMPRFTRIEHIHDNLLFPDMHDFDPII
jgi:hypothetical protein